MLGTETEEDSLYVGLVHLDSRPSGSHVAGFSVQNYCILVLAVDELLTAGNESLLYI